MTRESPHRRARSCGRAARAPSCSTTSPSSASTPAGGVRWRGGVGEAETRALALLLAALPILAYAPAWLETRLLGPGEGAALHFPMRAEVWRAYARGDLPSWNPGHLLGNPAPRRVPARRLPSADAAPRPAAALRRVPGARPGSLAAAAALSFLYLRRLGAERVGAYVGALAFALGPYLVAHLGDTATLVAAPFVPLRAPRGGAAPRARGTPRGRRAPRRRAGPPPSRRLAGGGGGRRLPRPPAARRPATSARARARPLASLLAARRGMLLAAPQLLPTRLRLRAKRARAMRAVAAARAPCSPA